MKVAVISAHEGHTITAGRVERIHSAEAAVASVDGQELDSTGIGNIRDALRCLIPEMLGRIGDSMRIGGVGHRVVHGGDAFSAPTRIDAAVCGRIEELSALAPLHNHANLEAYVSPWSCCQMCRMLRYLIRPFMPPCHAEQKRAQFLQTWQRRIPYKDMDFTEPVTNTWPALLPTRLE